MNSYISYYSDVGFLCRLILTQYFSYFVSISLLVRDMVVRSTCIWTAIFCSDTLLWYRLTWWLSSKFPYTLMLLLDIRHVFIIILYLEINYYYLNPKRTPIIIYTKINSISVPFVSLGSNKPATWLLVLVFNYPDLSLNLHVKGCKKYIFKMVYCRKLDLTHKKIGQVYPYVVDSVKVLTI